MKRGEPFEYVFTAISGRQAGREFYITMCPLKLVPKLFLFQEEELPAELRAQRTLNKARVPEIASYMTSNRETYLFSSITASIDGPVSFEPFSEDEKSSENIGKLHIPMDARFLINDGQHRRAAIEAALRDAPDLGDESISVVFFIDVGLKHSQQMFADLNKHAVRPTRSLGILYDHRDPLSVLAKTVVLEVPILNDMTEMEKTSISNRSTKLFTLSSIYQGTMSLLRLSPGCKKITDRQRQTAIGYWAAVCENIPDWQLAHKKEVSTHELRSEYVHAHALAIHALGRLGADLLSSGKSSNWKRVLTKLKGVDWSRRNSAVWEGRAMIAGKISKSHNCVVLTTNYLKTRLSLTLTPEERKVEKAFLREST